MRFFQERKMAPEVGCSILRSLSAVKTKSQAPSLCILSPWRDLAFFVLSPLSSSDTARGSFAPSTSWLDWAMCIGWFGGALLYSSRLIAIFSYLFNAGLSSIPTGPFLLFRQAWMVLLAAISTARENLERMERLRASSKR